ncbi:hypothetical protein ACH36K_11400 [Clostridium sp. MB05]|uniref:hypothetical protein n=1 Tax=Clostridium sp. MB05 TaxID=3376682 RepID=UPI003981CBBD
MGVTLEEKTNNYVDQTIVGQDFKPKKKKIRTFFKNYYKEIIAVFIAIGIGNSLGSIGKVGSTEVNDLNSEIKENTSILEDKQNEVDTINSSINELKLQLNN